MNTSDFRSAGPLRSAPTTGVRVGGRGAIEVAVLHPTRVPPALYGAAAARLVGGGHNQFAGGSGGGWGGRGRGGGSSSSLHGESGMSPGERLVANASSLGIDLSLQWATLEPAGAEAGVRQVCLAVPGAGGTVLMFVSATPARESIFRSTGRAGQEGSATDQLERTAVITAACDFCASPPAEYRAPAGGAQKAIPLGGAVLAQALVEPREQTAIRAFMSAGFTRLGDLAYLRRAAPKPPPANEFPPLPLPEGVRVRSVASLLAEGLGPAEIDRRLTAALERTYERTLDCPELCGMREAGDVLQSHRAVGIYDPALWWLVSEGRGEGLPEGVVLFSMIPDQQGVELVYLGLSPRLRGRGIGVALLHLGFGEIARRRAPVFRANDLPARDSGSTPGFGAHAFPGGIVCAVDTRNAPALRLYRRMGFERYSLRVPLVRSLVKRGSPGK